MLPSWHLILFIIFFDSVFGHSAKTNNNIHEDIQSNIESGDDDYGFDTDSNDAKYKMNENMNTTTDNNEINNDDDSDNNQGNVVYLNKVKQLDSSKSSPQAGDIFTPIKLLPIAKKLFEKSKANPEENQGEIVSGGKCPEDVSDRIFRAFFITDRRIVKLTGNDLVGLKQLNTLATENEEGDLDVKVDKIIADQVKRLKPQFKGPDLMIETLDEYFNNLVKAQYTWTTLPPDSDEEIPEIHPLQESEYEESQERRKKILRRSMSAEELRNLGGETVKAKNTAFRNVGGRQKLHSRSGSTASKLNKYHIM